MEMGQEAEKDEDALEEDPELSELSDEEDVEAALAAVAFEGGKIDMFDQS